MKKKKINVGIGFVTGRKNFKEVVRSYLDSWNEAETLNKDEYALSLFIAYDLKYTGTKISDYKISDEEILNMVDSAYYLGTTAIKNEIEFLVQKKVVKMSEANHIFGEGYAMKRNSVLYFALKNKMDYLIFLDDDEYPVAALNIHDTLVWKGQEVISTHINNIKYADMTHGHHCGYISPIPYFEFDKRLQEEDFRRFIEAISNDIITWESVKEKMNAGGVTFADIDIINSKKVEHVKEINGMKFISGANLGFNLKNIEKIFPFYNPPRARGEDAFLSTTIGTCNIRKIPCYTFHDGFCGYERLLKGVLPNNLVPMVADKGLITKRFLKAAIGWIRYKPLLVYITDRDNYDSKMDTIYKDLEDVLPKICNYFGTDEFLEILSEFKFYCENVDKHYIEFEKTKSAWIKIVKYVKE